MRLVTRYLLREHVGPLVFSLGTLTSLLLLNYISKRFGDLVGKGLPWSVIGQFFLLSVPFTVAMTLPMAMLIATLYAFSRVAADSEITAMMACGISTRQLMTPVIGLGLVMSLFMIGFNDQVLPRSNQRLSTLSANIQQKKPTLALKPQMLNEIGNRGLFMWIGHIDQRNNTMRDGVTIYDLQNNMKRHTIVADSGRLAFAMNQRDLLLTLYDGYVQETQAMQPLRFERTFFHTDILKVANVQNELQLDTEGGYKSDREMTVCELQAEIRRYRKTRDSTMKQLQMLDSVQARTYGRPMGNRTGELYCRAIASLMPAEAKAQGTGGQGAGGGGRGDSARAVIPQTPQIGRAPAPPVPPGKALSQKQLARMALPPKVGAMMDEVDMAQRQIASYEVEIQKKFALAFACLIFALLGPPIALRFPRAGVGLVIGVSMVVFGVYYIGLIAGETLGNNLKASPILCMWAANAIFGTLGVILVARMGRAGVATRGGGFLDRLLFRRRRPAPRPA